MEKKTISICCLTDTFPGFIWKNSVLELTGWNPQTNEWIVIEDGMCQTDKDDNEEYTWVFWRYQLYENVNGLDLFAKGRKWLSDDEGFCDEEQRIKLVW